MQKSDLLKLTTDNANKIRKEKGEPVVYLKDVTFIFNVLVDTIKDRLLFGVDIKIKDFLNFERIVRKARMGSNPRNGEKFQIPKKWDLRITMPRTFVKKIQSKPIH